MQKVVVDCETGQSRVEDLSPEEIAQRQADEAAAAAEAQAVAEREAARTQREADLDALVAQFRQQRASG